MKDQRSCSRCSFSTSDNVARCPQCGGWMRGAQRIRRLGWVLIVIGVFLIVTMGTVTFFTGPTLLSPGTTTGGARFTGTADQAILILGLFGVVIIFGIGAVFAGIWQIATGRRSIWIIIVMLLITFVLVAVAGVVRQSLDRKHDQGSLSGGQAEVSSIPLVGR